MTSRAFAAFACAGVALFLTAAARADESLPGCREALAPATYDPLLDLPPQTIERIEAYRVGWQRLCAGERGNISLHELMVQAKGIEGAFEAIFRREAAILDKLEDQQARWRRAEGIHRLVASVLPAFVPGFEGSWIEWEYFKPATVFFREHSSLGDREDRLTLESGILVDGSITAPHPWFKYTWDYGGCYRFGEFDWVAEIRKIEDLRDQLHRELYRSALARYERSLYNALTLREVGCVCKDPASVVPDLEKISDFLTSSGEREEMRRSIEDTVANARDGKPSLDSLRCRRG